MGAGSDTSAHLFCTARGFDEAVPNELFTAFCYATTMFPQKVFGKLGNRKMARLAADVDAGMLLPDGRVQCRLENASRTGCCLTLGAPPRVGTDAIIRIAEIEVFGTVAWARGKRCGITFDRPLSIAAVERLRWIIEHAGENEAAALVQATALWR